MVSTFVTILILNWNGRQFLERCLASVRAQTFQNFEVVLVDNGSTDGSTELIHQHFGEWLKAETLPRLRLVELPQNEGFSGGNLAGWSVSDPASQYIATLNNDTWVDPDWLAQLVALIDGKADCGAVAGPMLFASDEGKIASAGIEVRRDGLALDRALGQPQAAMGEQQEIFGPCAGAALYRRAALEDTGFFDPAFFAYLEDADLAWRLRLRGWYTLYQPTAKVWHEYSGTGGQNSPFKNFQLGRNRIWVILKNWPARFLWRYGCWIVAYDLAACAYTLLKGQPQSTLGRLTALKWRHLRRVWQQRRSNQTRRIATLAELERWLLPVVGPKATLQTRQIANSLAAHQPKEKV